MCGGLSRFEPDEVQVSVAPAPPVESTWRSVRAAMVESAESVKSVESAEGKEVDTVLLRGSVAPETDDAPIAQEQGLLTRGGFIAGTPLARAGTRATSSADLFNFGIVAWELLVKTRPCLRPPAMAVLQGDEPDQIPSLARYVLPPTRSHLGLRSSPRDSALKV